ncbi:MAG: prolyl oligopeptidase family serine peptidase, partial [Chloroflexales bacterium]|nr:prolyl oligopeptidase family serine peptidase [Chloroflexales bacterium]
LQSATFPFLFSDVSPDNQAILTFTDIDGTVFRDLRSGAITKPDPSFSDYSPLSDFRWRDAQTLVFVGSDPNGATALVTVDRITGAVAATAYTPPGFVLSLSPTGRRMLVGVQPGQSRSQTPSDLRRNPFDIEMQRGIFERPGPATFETDAARTIRLNSVELSLHVVDLASNKVTPLLDLPVGSALIDTSWSGNDAVLSLVRWQFPDFRRGGVVSLESATVQDGLGRLPPAENPFLANNVLELFRFTPNSVRSKTLPAVRGNGDLINRITLSQDGRTLLAKVRTPAQPAGRNYPTYSTVNGAYYVAFSSTGAELRIIDNTEVSAGSSGAGVSVSRSEAVISAASGLSWGLFVVDLATGELQRLPTPEGAIYQVQPTPSSREFVYSLGSIQQPYELYRIGMNDDAPTALTTVNAHVAAVNNVRVDRLQFELRNGAQREGYLIQPADAAFPPRNIPLIVWQQGGPTGSMTNDWGGFVEQPFNLLPNFGFAVLVTPLPGREGFGPDFLDALADNANFGQIDIDEQAEIVEQLIDRGYTSRDRVGITGCSYGGYFASQSIASYPDLYAAANPQCALLDLFDEWETGYKAYVGYLLGRTAGEDPAEYTRDSPVLNADQVRTPLLIFAGTLDFLPYTISGQFHDTVEAAGTPVDFLVFEDEGHGLFFPSSQYVAGEAQLLWFRQYLNS